MGRVHDFGDRRLRLPGIAGLVTAVAGTAVIAWAGHWGATIAGAVAVVALASWLVIYVRISAPVNARLKGAAQGDDVVMHSPILTESLTGRDQVLGVLGAVFDAVDEFVLGEVLSGPAWSPSRTGLLQP
jgi:hypothetical protein